MLTPSEFIERAELKDLHDAATPALKAALGLETLEHGPTLVSMARRLPDSAIVINRALGLGMEGPETEQSVQRIVSAYREQGIRRFLLQKHPDAKPSSLVRWLQEAGLVKTRGWQKFSRGRQPVPATPTNLSIREIGPEQGQAFGKIVCDAFDLGQQSAPWLAQLPGRTNWRVFMSFDNGEPAGTGTLFILGKYAWTDFGATAPAFRRRGSQAALLAARIQCALNAGCEDIFTCTGEEVANDPQHSYKNILKMGFREAHLRENYAPPRCPPPGQ